MVNMASSMLKISMANQQSPKRVMDTGTVSVYVGWAMGNLQERAVYHHEAY